MVTTAEYVANEGALAAVLRLVSIDLDERICVRVHQAVWLALNSLPSSIMLSLHLPVDSQAVQRGRRSAVQLWRKSPGGQFM